MSSRVIASDGKVTLGHLSSEKTTNTERKRESVRTQAEANRAPMPGKPPTYSAQQKAACLRRLMKDKRPATAVAHEARTGKLGLPPFPVTVETCRRWRSEAQLAEELETPVTVERWEEVTARLWKVHLSLVQDLERAAGNRKNARESDLERLSRLSAVTTSAMKRHAAARALAPGSSGPDPVEAETERKGFLDRLADAEHSEPETPDTTQPTHTPREEREADMDSDSVDVDSEELALGRAASRATQSAGVLPT